MASSKWYKNEPTDKVWWKDNDAKGEFVFSFDKEKEYNLFADYPHKLTIEEQKIFNEENPYWVNFFIDRYERRDNR